MSWRKTSGVSETETRTATGLPGPATERNLQQPLIVAIEDGFKMLADKIETIAAAKYRIGMAEQIIEGVRLKLEEKIRALPTHELFNALDVLCGRNGKLIADLRRDLDIVLSQFEKVPGKEPEVLSSENTGVDDIVERIRAYLKEGRDVKISASELPETLKLKIPPRRNP